MKKILILGGLLQFSALLWAGDASGAGSGADKSVIARDTLNYKRVKERPYSYKFSFTFPQNKSTFLWEYGKNADEVERLNKVVNDIRTNDLIVVRHILAAGYSSMEGGSVANTRLSHDRVESVNSYLDKKYRLGRDYPIYMSYVGEDWKGLREKIAHSGMYRKEDLLAVIDNNESPETRKDLLRLFDNGVPYDILFTEVFPSLRRVDLVVEYDLYKMVEKCNPCDGYSREEVDDLLRKERMAVVAEFARILADRSQSAPPVQPEIRAERKEQPEAAPIFYVKPKKQKAQPKGEFFPLIGVKTNLFSWAGVTPEFEHKTLMPNLAIEFFFMPKWSVLASGTYAYWDYGKRDEFWGMSGYGVEPRFWPLGGGKHEKLYVGAFGLSGDYDVREWGKDATTTATDNFTGKYWQAGLSAGYYLPVTANFGFEFGLRGGYQKSKSKVYEISVPDNIYQYSLNESRWGIMEVNVSLSFRFGKRK